MSTPGPEVAPRWSPLLEDDLASRATAAVVYIATTLRRGADPADASLGSGSAGIAVFFDYLATTGLDVDAAADATTFLDDAIDATAGGAIGPSLYAGFTGVAWATALFDAGAGGPDELDDVDEVLVAITSRSPWPYDYDLVRGLVGHGVYALERLPRPTAVRLLEQVVGRLAELAEHRRDGITWFTRPELLPPDTRREFPRGYYDAGVAHGVPGVIALLARCVDSNVAADVARELLEGGVSWLLRRRLPSGGLPAVVTPGAPRDAARAAWCYGDPGVACALLLAGRSLRNEAWERDAVAIARAAGELGPDSAGVRDACLCHGAAGLGHLLNRLHHATGDGDLRAAATRWLRRALEMRHAGRGVAGFATWSETGMSADPGFLQGAAGVGLALAAAVTSVEPEWDRALLVSHRAAACGPPGAL